MDLRRAVLFVKSRGTVLERARMATILRDRPPSQAVIRGLKALQRPDGGFAYWIREVSTVCDTACVLQWLDDLGVRRGPIVDRAVGFVAAHQKEDSGWDEVEALRGHSPPEWLVPGRADTRAWLTALCSHVLLRFGQMDSRLLKGCPLRYLYPTQAPGRLPGYLRATWLALPLLAHRLGPASELFRGAVAAVQQEYSPDGAGSYLAWLLRCLGDAGLTAEHPLAARALADLEHKQSPDGSWESEDGEQYRALATVEALRALKVFGRLG